MKIEIAEALLQRVLEKSTIRPERIDGYRKYFQRMAKYKYDSYEQYATGMRFLEKLALWLNSIEEKDREVAIEFIKNRLVFVSQSEMHLLVEACYPDLIKQKLMETISEQKSISPWSVRKLVQSEDFRIMLRRSLFLGMSDGARIDEFRRSNTGIISHEQIYQTYELSDARAQKMQKELEEDFPNLFKRKANSNEATFQRLFLMDDFSASGTSYLKYDNEADLLKGKIGRFYESLFDTKKELIKIFDKKSLKIYIVIYLCTEQAHRAIESNFDIVEEKFGNRPELLTMHLISDTFKLDPVKDKGIWEICQKNEYYDKNIEDKHTEQGGYDVKMGFSKCALPLILHHNTPNNSVPILWSYENLKFEGLFQRIPRHVVL
jgi:hypothetical protein